MRIWDARTSQGLQATEEAEQAPTSTFPETKLAVSTFMDLQIANGRKHDMQKWLRTRARATVRLGSGTPNRCAMRQLADFLVFGVLIIFSIASGAESSSFGLSCAVAVVDRCFFLRSEIENYLLRRETSCFNTFASVWPSRPR